MNRYHFNIGGESDSASQGRLGLAGAIFAHTMKDALAILQAEVLDDEVHELYDNGEVSDGEIAEPFLGYLDLCINDTELTAVSEMFDEIEHVSDEPEDEPVPSDDEPAAAATT